MISVTITHYLFLVLKKSEKSLINSFFVCATEQSGDNIGEKVINQLKKNINNSIFEGVGGNKMSYLLNKQYYSVNNFKSIGIIEIIGSIKKYILIIEKLSEIILINNYKIVITIDSPDFNYRLAKKIRKKGFKGKIIHIVAPTVWAWRKGRAKDFAKIYDKLFVILPFEAEYFMKHNLNTTYIGHPIYYINNHRKNNQIKYIAFLPGSREGEILPLIKYFKILSDYVYNINLNLKIFVPTLPHLKEKLIFLTKNWKFKPIFEVESNKIEKMFSQTSFAVVCSGTASLEITKRNIPQLVVYKMNLFTELILHFFVYIKYANIINIMANDMIIPEITNSSLSKNTILEGFKKLLMNYSNQNNKQIIGSKKFLNQLILKDSPAKIASKEIEKLFFPKPFKD